jgi:hypothetical protein
MKHFADNLKRIESIMKGWAKNLDEKSHKELKEVEDGINALFENNDASIFSDEEAYSLKELEGKKKDILDREEATWRLKSRALWIKEGDNNTIFSQIC